MSQADTPPAPTSVAPAPVVHLPDGNSVRSAALETTDSLDQLHLPEVPPPPPEAMLMPLRALREGKNRSTEDVASALRLSQAQINALEAARWADLPGAAYVKGFLRNYARYLGVEAQPYIDEYNSQTQNPALTVGNTNGTAKHATQKEELKKSSDDSQVLKNDPPALESFNTSGQDKSSSKGLAATIAVLIAATLAFLLFWERNQWLPFVTPHLETVSAWFASPGKTSAVGAPVATSTDNDGAKSAATASTPNATPDLVNDAGKTASTAAIASDTNVSTTTDNPALNTTQTTPSAVNAPKVPASGPVRAMTLQYSKPVWVEIRDSAGNVLVFGTKAPGEQQIKGRAPLTLVIGAADAVKISLDGQAFDVQAKAQGNVAKFSVD